MSGHPGQMGTKPVEVEKRFRKNFLDAMDGRDSVVREMRDNLHALVADLGGWSNLSFQERSSCERAIHIIRHIKRDELRLAQGLKVDENLHLNYINTLSGLWTKLGMKRRVKVLETYDEYVNGKTVAVSTATKGKA